MKGYKISFFSVRSRRFDGLSIDEFLLRETRTVGIKGISIFDIQKGYDHQGVCHSAGFFELVDEAIEIVVVADGDACEKLFARLATSKANIFYTKTAVEFGVS